MRKVLIITHDFPGGGGLRLEQIRPPPARTRLRACNPDCEDRAAARIAPSGPKSNGLRVEAYALHAQVPLPRVLKAFPLVGHDRIFRKPLLCPGPLRYVAAECPHKGLPHDTKRGYRPRPDHVAPGKHTYNRHASRQADGRPLDRRFPGTSGRRRRSSTGPLPRCTTSSSKGWSASSTTGATTSSRTPWAMSASTGSLSASTQAR